MQKGLAESRTVNGDRRRGFEFVQPVSAAWKALEEAVANVASSSIPVLILGEMGAGKRTLAYRLHELSRRKQDQFEERSCPVVTPDALASLFAASNGNRVPATVLLTDIASLAAPCQVLLLEVLQRYEASGSGTRIVVSSQRNLEQEVQAGQFREDLYYRLTGVCLRVPPLRHRREDIPVFTDHFLRKYSNLFGRPEPQITASTRRFLTEYSWPGNVSELEATVKTIAAIGDERIALLALRSGSMNGARNNDREATSLKAAARAASRQAERELILRVLSRTRWNRKRAAEELQISYKALLYKLKQIGVDEYTKTLAHGDDV